MLVFAPDDATVLEAEAKVLAMPGVTSVYAVIGPRAEGRRASWRINLVDKAKRSEGIDAYKRVRGVVEKIRYGQYL